MNVLSLLIVMLAVDENSISLNSNDLRLEKLMNLFLLNIVIEPSKTNCSNFTIPILLPYEGLFE